MNPDLLTETTVAAQTVLLLVAIAGALLLSTLLFNRLLLPRLFAQEAAERRQLFRYRATATSWMCYTLFALYRLLVDSLPITLALTAFVLLVGWHFWRDFFAGLFFRMEGAFRLHDVVQLGEYSGKIDAIGRRAIQVKTAEGDRLTIPFRRLSNALFTKRRAQGKWYAKQLTFHLKEHYSTQIADDVPDWIFQCPWVIPHEDTTPILVAPTLLQLTVYTADEAAADRAAAYLKAKIATAQSAERDTEKSTSPAAQPLSGTTP